LQQNFNLLQNKADKGNEGDAVISKIVPITREIYSRARNDKWYSNNEKVDEIDDEE